MENKIENLILKYEGDLKKLQERIDTKNISPPFDILCGRMSQLLKVVSDLKSLRSL